MHIYLHTHDADQWITLKPSGTHILIGENGEVKQGAGGKMNGKKISSAQNSNNTKPPVSNEKSAKPAPAKLTANEKSYLSSYSGDDFLRINQNLRAGNDKDPAVSQIDSAIGKSSLPAGTKLYRGMNKEAAKKLFPGGHITKGMEISDPAFVSTSRSYGAANSWGIGGVILKIEVESEAKGIDMKRYSRNENENEVLLPRNAKMKVVGLTAPKEPWDPVIVRVAYGD